MEIELEGNVKKHELQASVCYISQVFSNLRSFLSQYNTQLRLLNFLYDIEEMRRKTMKNAFSMFYTLIKHGFSTNQSAKGFH